MDEIQRPACVGRRLDEDRRPRSHGTPLLQREAFFAIEPVDAVDPGRRDPFALPLMGWSAPVSSPHSIEAACGGRTDRIPAPPFLQHCGRALLLA